MSGPHDTDPAVRARGATEFFGPRVPGQLGCVFDHSAADLVVGHIDVTANLIAGTGFLFAPAVIALADTCAAIGCGNNIPAGSSPPATSTCRRTRVPAHPPTRPLSRAWGC
jgi:acyl-coenzyme A thioesterase PaaI-like protein